jgi:hypothetical protein
MKKMLFAICVLLVSVSASFAVTFGNSSLKGKYSFQLVAAHLNFWNATITCHDPQGNPYTVEAGGSNVSNDSILGVATFDGKGNLTGGAFTQYGIFDQAASNATVVPSCTPGGSNNGYAVYDPPLTLTVTGTYSVQPTGFGALVLTIAGGGTGNFLLELAGTGAVRNFVSVTEYGASAPYRVFHSGSAVLQ